MKHYPVIKFAVPFICGIILNQFFCIPLLIYPVLFTAFIIIFLLIRLLKLKYIQEVSLLLYPLILLLGLFTARINAGNQSCLSPNIYVAKNLTAFGEIESIDLLHYGYDMPADNRKKTITFRLKADSLSANQFSLSKKIILNCSVQDTSDESLDSLYNSLKPGNYISISGSYYKGRERRNPGEFNYDKYLRAKGISGTFISYNAGDVHTLKKEIYPFENFLFTIRKSIHERIIGLHSPVTASLLKGLLLNDRSEMNNDTKNEFINSGVIHVLAVSGLHVGYIILVFVIILGRFNIYARSVLTAAGLILFMLLTGSPASVVRAVLMALIIIAGFLSGRSTNLFNSLALSAVIILLIDPGDLFDPGFQLSYAAVSSMAAIYPFFRRMIVNLNPGKFVKNLLLFITLSLSAQIGTIPFTLFYFGRLSLTALFANLFVIPAIGMVVGVSIFTLTISIVSPFAASFYASANNLLTFITLEFIKFSGNPGYSFLWIRNFSLIDSIIFYILLIIFFFGIEKFKGWKSKIILSSLVIINMIFLPSLDDRELLKKNELNIMMIDVGQGDAFLIKFPDGETALIDAGDKTFGFDNGERVVFPLLNHLSISKIDFAFISHLDADHCGGFKSLIARGIIKQAFKPKIDSLDESDLRFEFFLRQYNVPISYYNREKIQIGNVKLYILNDQINFIPASNNEKSGIIKIIYGKTSFLFTGDAEKKNEKILMNQYRDFLNCSVLKISHHGSNTSSSQNFIDAVNPQYALISCGIGNKFGHPSKKVLERLKGIKVFRTDKDAAVLLSSDGEKIHQINWKNL